MDKIIEKLPKDNDRYYIEHLIESKKRKWKIKNCLKKQKNVFNSLKTGPISVLFSEESKYEKDKLLLKIILLVDNLLESDGKILPRTDYIEKVKQTDQLFIVLTVLFN